MLHEPSSEYSTNCNKVMFGVQKAPLNYMFGVQKALLNMFWEYSPSLANLASDWLRAKRVLLRMGKKEQ